MFYIKKIYQFLMTILLTIIGYSFEVFFD